jgi:hypothetical protein
MCLLAKSKEGDTFGKANRVSSRCPTGGHDSIDQIENFLDCARFTQL